MKTRTVMHFVAATLISAPLLAHGAARDSIQLCMDAFADENFPNRNVSFVVQETSMDALPLIAQTGTQSVKVVATSKSDGRVLATTTCRVKMKEGVSREGKVDLMPLE